MFTYLKNNWVAILGVVIGIIGILLSYYFYSLSVKSREPAYLITKNDPLFSSPKGLSSEYLKLVTRDDGKELLKNLYVQEVAIWNNGKESIKAENILTPLSLVFSKKIELIDAFISESKRPEIVSAKLEFAPGGNVVNLDFKILEYKDGFKVQLVYAALDSQSASLQGVVEGVESIKKLSDLSKEKVIASIAKVLVGFVLIVVAFAAFVSIGEITKWLCDKLFGEKSEKVYLFIENLFAYSFAILMILAFAFFIYAVTVEVAEDSAVESIPVMENLRPNKSSNSDAVTSAGS